MILPSVIIAGAQKSGTTTVRGMMAQHPDIFMSTPKELHYFDRYYDRRIDWYSSCFDAGASFTHRGESTPYYMYNPTFRERMLTTLPELKVICILRNPIARTPITGTRARRSREVTDLRSCARTRTSHAGQK